MWNQTISELQHHLAHLFPLQDDIIRIAGTAGIPVQLLSVSDKGIIFWYNVLHEAQRQGKLDEVILEARRLYPEDEKLSTFSAQIIDRDQHIDLGVLKDLCADILREGQLAEAMPLLEVILSRSAASDSLEENIVVRMANLHRHAQDVAELEGGKKKRAMRHLELARSELLSVIHAL